MTTAAELLQRAGINISEDEAQRIYRDAITPLGSTYDLLWRVAMDWRLLIHTDPRVMSGKPVVKGTRLSVEFLLGLFTEGWTVQQVLDSYPTLTPDGLRAAFAFAAECVGEQSLYTVAAPAP